MVPRLYRSRIVGLLVVAGCTLPIAAAQRNTYDDLVTLFQEFIAFERPGLREGAPDYTAATLQRKHAGLKALQSRLSALDPKGWPIEQQVDHALVGALMNGYDFDLRVLRPWARDPAYYKTLWTAQSDTPAHEGPTQHGVIELWTYTFPLTAADQAKLAGELRTIPPLLAQARTNLTGNARDLWVTGTGTMAQQGSDLEALKKRVPNASAELGGAISGAQRAT